MDSTEGKKFGIEYGEKLQGVVQELCRSESYGSVFHQANHDVPMPSVEVLAEIVEMMRALLFPGYFGHAEVNPATIKFYTGSVLDRIFAGLSEQIRRGYCFTCSQDEKTECSDCELRAKRTALEFIEKLPYIRSMLSTDAQAAFEGDPAAKHVGETIFCYPSIKALSSHRIAHELFRLDAQIIPRIISEMAHSETGIDIHPGATIGKSCFIDHGTGVVIGETAKIGKNVRIYQGVTLGARSFPLDELGNPVKGIDRHPIVDDDVVIYSGATILGRVTIGRGAEIGGNVWITEDIPAEAKIHQMRDRDFKIS